MSQNRRWSQVLLPGAGSWMFPYPIQLFVCFKYNFNTFYFVKLMTVAKVHPRALGSGGLGLKTQGVPAMAQWFKDLK